MYTIALIAQKGGTGKTTLAAALLQGLGVRETVRSPSYTLIEVYEAAAGRAVHIDLYRLQGPLEASELGLRADRRSQNLSPASGSWRGARRMSTGVTPRRRWRSSRGWRSTPRFTSTRSATRGSSRSSPTTSSTPASSGSA